ncbi:histidine phosphatase family protein [Rodentibacter caecimuris]|uniref:phosphoglycerate mutase (2,3-diphosphoglycerate-dependent) n=1 Tax=Rodentibacter caecimuris TaxID=1796644 RepID=A0ABX3KWH2_9PAST|nr:histidine phosphatase family protein [Rodentibacter heylii]
MQKQLTFYFIRHGRTKWNEQGLIQGSGNSPLTKQGIIDAQKAGMALQHIPFIAAYSSILQRTIDTAQHIIGQRNIPLFQHIGLNEQHFGSWEGKHIDELRHLNEFQQMQADPASYKALSNNGETYQSLAERISQALQDIIAIHQQGNILIVSHGHTLRLLLALLNGANWHNHRESNRSVSLLNTAISIVHYVENVQGKNFIIEKINDTQHLNE